MTISLSRADLFAFEGKYEQDKLVLARICEARGAGANKRQRKSFSAATRPDEGATADDGDIERSTSLLREAAALLSRDGTA